MNNGGADDVDYEARAQLLQGCLKDLIGQMMVGPLVDELGNDFRMNDAFIRAAVVLELVEGGSDQGAQAA
jgi:hypothetical protein